MFVRYDIDITSWCHNIDVCSINHYDRQTM